MARDKEKRINYNKKYWEKYIEKNREKLREKRRKRWSFRYYNDSVFRKKCLEKSKKYQKPSLLRLRFLLLKKYDFTCQYCGRKAPDVVLQIDHIHPKSKGGKNKISNYLVACSDCNLGKGDILL